MKKKYLKIAAFVVALGLIGFVAYFANGLLGNPVSKMMAKRTVKLYLEEKYSDTDYYMKEINYSFKDGCYHAHIRSRTSEDSAFTCWVDQYGKLKYDSYKTDVSERFNTARRIEDEYRELTDLVFESPAFPYECHIGYGTLEIATKESIAQGSLYEVPPYSLLQEKLELDKLYDVRELGKKAGHLIIYMEDSEVTMERAAERMLAMKQQFDDAKVPFAAMNFSLFSPRKEDKQSEETIHVEQFLYEDIYEEGMEARVKEASKQLEAYYATENEKK